jgi:hypothetical protein
MDKRLAKRHKRQVAREREKITLSEPDLRTPEQIKAAREASRPTGSGRGEGPPMLNSTQSNRERASVGTGSAAKTAV